MNIPDLQELTAIRAQQPGRIEQAWAERRGRDLLADDGRLLIIAADHPARAALGVRDEPYAMANRGALLARIVEALAVPGVDGVLATADILEDLLLLGALDDKVVIGSMNRGGLQGAAFEFDDCFTGYDAATIARLGLNGGKTLTRVALEDAGSVRTLQATAKAIDELTALQRIAMIEPFWSARRAGRVVNELDAGSVVKSVAVASGLGASSAYTWLKLPVVDDMERVMEATTLPTLLLGGDPHTAPEETYATWRKALALPAVRGLVVGRALLYPPSGSVTEAVQAAVAMVHPDASMQEQS